MSSINFDNVYLLFIAIPLIVLLAVPFFMAFRRDNLNVHNITSSALHVIMAVLIAFSAAGTKIVTVVTETDVYVVADVSYSANKNLDEVDGYIQLLEQSLPQNSRMGVICFGKDYRLTTRLGEKFETVKGARVDDSETDIVSALEYAGSIFRDGVIKRIVLITDGRQTDSRDTNALKRAVDNLVADGIKVDAIYLDDNIDADSREVQVTSVEYTQNAYLNHNESVTAVVQSSYNTNAIVSLYSGENKLSSKAVTLVSGSTSVNFDLDTSVGGDFDYEIRVEADEDENPYNNSNYFTQTVTGSVNVLLISDNYSDLAAAQNIYGELATIDAYINVTSVPCSVEALCAYDEILLSDYDVSKMSNYEMFLESLDTVVSRFGKSLITMGDLSIQNRTDSALKSLEDMLPVRYGNYSNDSKLYTIVIDGSRSMENLSKFIIAKSAAIKLIDSLSDNDYVCVVCFYGDVDVVQSPTSAANREEVKKRINNLEAYQGTFIGLGLEKAMDTIKLLDYSDKQIMLISDGRSFTDDLDDPIGIAKEMRTYGIVTSTLYVGGDGTDETTVNAKQLMKNIAQNGGGNDFYINPSTDDAEDKLNDLVFGEMANEISTTVIEKNSYVKVERRTDDVLEGIEDISYISGYLNNKKKASATTVLTAGYQKDFSGNLVESSTGGGVPLYAYWSYGNGRVATFTAKFSGNWIKKWTEDGTAEKFFTNVLFTNTPAEKIDYPYTVEVSTESGYSHVELIPGEVRSDAVATVKVTCANGDVYLQTLALSDSYYSYDFASPDVGKYTIELTYSYGGYVYTSSTQFNISYLPEYDSFATYDSSVLHKMIDASGQVSEDGNLTLVNDENQVALRTIYLTIPLLITCVALFAVDIIVRKIKWNDIKSLFVKVNKS